jgi:hypothetical protein
VAFGSAAITLAATAAILVPIALRGRLGAKPLLVGGVFYVAYVVVVAVALVRPGG